MSFSNSLNRNDELEKTRTDIWEVLKKKKKTAKLKFYIVEKISLKGGSDIQIFPYILKPGEFVYKFVDQNKKKLKLFFNQKDSSGNNPKMQEEIQNI
jgi:hypothetical protein